MKLSFTSKLACPLCASDLRAKVFSGDELNIENGALLCDACKTWYPVANYVPVLLDFKIGFHDSFVTKFGHGALLEGYSFPSGSPRPGEASVQETFSDQWDTVQDNEMSFTFTPSELVALHRDVWLNWLPRSGGPRTVLNVGCGLGRESAALQAAIGAETEVVGIDLNLACIQSGSIYKDRPDFHIVVASLFALPFKQQSFDLVYTQGVIHHTFSTEKAFQAISRFAEKRGFIFVWVYGLDDHLMERGARGFARRTLWAVESIFRPVVSRSPGFIRDGLFWLMSAIIHPLYRNVPSVRRQGVAWKRENTEHALRDKFSPMFAYRHSANEVIEWMENEGFGLVGYQSPKAYRKIFGVPLFGVGFAAQRLEAE